MKPVITSGNATNPTAANGADGTIVLSGLNPGASYGVSFSKNGNPDTAVGTADDNGDLTISGLTAGSYTSIVVTQSGNNEVGETHESSDAYAGEIILNDQEAQPATENTSFVADPQATKANGDGDGISEDSKEGVLNDFLVTFPAENPREGIEVGSETIKDELYKLRDTAADCLPVTKRLMGIFITECVANVDATKEKLLLKLEAASAE